MVDETEAVIEKAIDAANKTFRDTDGGFPAGFAMVKGLDGRRNETRVAESVEGITVDKGGYHGTTLSVDRFGGQFLQPKASGYRAFLEVCQENGLFEDATVWSRMD